MPNIQKVFDIERLKKDPGMWMRLAMPGEDNDHLKGVFSTRENPFEKDSKAATEKVQALINEGKLYLRENGRSRHYRKVEKDGDVWRLGQQKEAKLESPYDPVRGLLMRLTRGYARLFGLEKLEALMDRRMEKYDAYRMQKKHHKSEYNAMTKEEKKTLKQLRKQEKKNSDREEQKASAAEKEAVQEKQPEKTPEQEKQPEKEIQLPQAQKDAGANVFSLEAFSEGLRELPLEVLQEIANIVNKQMAKETQNKEKGEMEAPLAKPPRQTQQPSMQRGRPKDTWQEQAPTLRERLAMEKTKLDAVRAWRDVLADSLFHSDVNKEYRDGYMRERADRAASGAGLAGVVCGMVGRGAEACGGPDKQQQILMTLISGQRLDSQFNKNVQDGVEAFAGANNALRQGDNQLLSQMLSNTIRELSKAASAEGVLPDQHVMIGRLISQTIEIAKEDPRIELDLSEEEIAAARGAVGLAQIADKSMRARQHLGSLGKLDLTNEDVRDSLQDILVGKAVENGMMYDKKAGEAITSTQLLLGTDLMSPQELKKMVNYSSTYREMTEEQLAAILLDPQGKTAKKAGEKLMSHFVKTAEDQTYEPVKQEVMLQKQAEVKALNAEEQKPELQPIMNA